MRVKKQKRHRKFVRFYTACFGFREPFKILCDGTFIHHLIDHQLTPADDKLSHLLGGKVQLFTTSCVIGEVKSLGKNYEETLQAAQDLVAARCDHEKRVGAGKCLNSIIGENNNNKEHFFVATQDKELRRKLREIPGVPVIYGLRNALFLEQPSEHQRKFVQSAEEKRLHVSELEYKKLQQIKLKDDVQVDSTDLHDDTQGDLNNKKFEITYSATRTLGVADKTKFKRKKAKGPNPLSCKKKKESNFSAAQSQNVETDGVTKKRKRSRKRKKESNAGESAS